MIEGFDGVTPAIDPTAWVHPSAVVIGRVTLGRRVSVWPGAVLRGDILEIDVGDESNIQDLCIAHTSHGVAPVKIGRRVVVGHRVILHGASVGDNALVGMGAVLLDGCSVGSGSIVAAGALITEGTRIPPNSLAVGIPARVVRQVTEQETLRIREGARQYLDLLAAYKKGK
jgi:carbonic anhydrase/acetyltransferase-like protein (isoleucine patch superfamily)